MVEVTRRPPPWEPSHLYCPQLLPGEVSCYGGDPNHPEGSQTVIQCSSKYGANQVSQRARILALSHHTPSGATTRKALELRTIPLIEHFDLLSVFSIDQLVCM